MDPKEAPALVPVALDRPEQMRDRWAAVAAFVTAQFGRGPSAEAGDWFYDDGGGNWARLYRFADGRALLTGSDHEHSDTYFGEAAAYFDEPETDLLAGAPDWWRRAVEDHDPRYGDWVSWIYGWDGSQWLRARYDTADGFESLNLPTVSDAAVTDFFSRWISDSDAEGDEQQLIDAALALVSAGPAVTITQVQALGAMATHPEAAVAAARAFADPGGH